MAVYRSMNRVESHTTLRDLENESEWMKMNLVASHGNAGHWNVANFSGRIKHHSP
jgi:hypothetical protein